MISQIIYILLLLILLTMSSCEASVPVAQTVSEVNVAVSEDKLVAAMAEENNRLARKKYEAEQKELARLTNARIQFDKAEHEERLEAIRKRTKVDEQLHAYEWRVAHPEAAAERDRLDRVAAQEKQRAQELEHHRQLERARVENDLKMKREQADAENKIMLEEVRLREWKENVRMVGMMLIPAGLGMLGYAAL